MSTHRVIGPIYTLDDSTRLQDVDSACGRCTKRLAVVLHDPHGCWPQGRLVCIDCGTLAPTYTAHRVKVQPSKQAPGKALAVCRCGRMSMITSRENAQMWADKHLEQAA